MHQKCLSYTYFSLIPLYTSVFVLGFIFVIRNLHLFQYTFEGRDSSVGTASRYGLDGPEIESRWGEIFRTLPDRPWDPHIILYNEYRVPPGDKAAVAWR
jgi:hypothetical protein